VPLDLPPGREGHSRVKNHPAGEILEQLTSYSRKSLATFIFLRKDTSMSERSTADAPAAEEAIAAAAMPTSRKLLCVLYATIAIAGLIGTWSQAIAYFTGVLDIVPSFVHFWVDTKATPASRFMHSEVVFFGLAAVTFMVIEARKHSIRLVWAYIAACPTLAISVAFPLFLLARELRRPTSDATHLKVVDIVSLAAVTFACIGMVIYLDVL
jgi:hypothetical protein